jgi:hypothetical protein
MVKGQVIEKTSEGMLTAKGAAAGSELSEKQLKQLKNRIILSLII